MPSLLRVHARPPAAPWRIPTRWVTITIVLGSAVVLASLGLFGPSTQMAEGTTPSIRLDPTAGAPGTSVHVRGRGLTAKRTLQVTWDNSSVGMPSAWSTGSFQATFTVPPASAGQHVVAVVDAAHTTVAAATFTVGSAAATATPTQAPAATPTSTATPAPPTTPAPTPTATSTPTATPAPTATSAPTPTPKLAPSSSTVRWALIGNDGTHLAAERNAGLTTKVFELGWSSYETSDGVFSSSYITAKRNEAAALRAAGFTLILSFGVQYTPSWLMTLPNARYVNQYGTAYADTSSGSGLANLIWNDDLRALEARYIARVFTDLGTDWAAVRIGGGRYGELGFPVAKYGTETNTYWAFDANAAKTDPVPGWRPGMASPNGEASRFASWYLDRLAGYATWQARTVRAYFPGRLMVLFPSFGIRPGQLTAAISGNLSGSTSPEINGEVPRGYDYARQVKALASFSGIVLTSTWLDCPYGNDASTSADDWRPIHYLTYLAGPYGMARYGENTGQASASVLRFTASQAKTYGLLGFAWFNERELLGGSYATLSDLAAAIAGS